MRYAIAMLALLAGCEGQNISQCGYACKQGGTTMQSYSATAGCICVAVDAGSR